MCNSTVRVMFAVGARVAWDVAARGAPQRERGCEVSWEGGGGRVCKSRVCGQESCTLQCSWHDHGFVAHCLGDLRAGIMALCKSLAIFAQPGPGAF